MRTVAVWLVLLGVAIANGAFRELVVAPRLGEYLAHVASVAILALLIAVVTAMTVRWLGPANAMEALAIGVVWTALTVTFEFGAGQYLFGVPWEQLTRDYRVLEGRLWPVVLATTLFAPLLAWLATRGGAHHHDPDGDGGGHRPLSWEERRAVNAAARRADQLQDE